MTLLGRKEQLMELSNQPVRSAFRVLEPLTNCPPDFSLHAALVKPAKKRADIGVEQKLVPIENAAFLEHRINRFRDHWSNLDVLAALRVNSLSQVRQQ